MQFICFVLVCDLITQMSPKRMFTLYSAKLEGGMRTLDGDMV